MVHIIAYSESPDCTNSSSGQTPLTLVHIMWNRIYAYFLRMVWLILSSRPKCNIIKKVWYTPKKTRYHVITICPVAIHSHLSNKFTISYFTGTASQLLIFSRWYQMFFYAQLFKCWMTCRAQSDKEWQLCCNVTTFYVSERYLLSLRVAASTTIVRNVPIPPKDGESWSSSVHVKKLSKRLTFGPRRSCGEEWNKLTWVM